MILKQHIISSYHHILCKDVFFFSKICECMNSQSNMKNIKLKNSMNTCHVLLSSTMQLFHAWKDLSNIIHPGRVIVYRNNIYFTLWMLITCLRMTHDCFTLLKWSFNHNKVTNCFMSKRCMSCSPWAQSVKDNAA